MSNSINFLRTLTPLPFIFTTFRFQGKHSYKFLIKPTSIEQQIDFYKLRYNWGVATRQGYTAV